MALYDLTVEESKFFSTTMKKYFFKAAERVRRGNYNYKLSEEISGGKQIRLWDKIITWQKCEFCVNKFLLNSWADKTNR